MIYFDDEINWRQEYKSNFLQSFMVLTFFGKKFLNKIDIVPAGVEDMTEFEFHFQAILLLKYPFWLLSNQSPTKRVEIKLI